MPFGLLFKKVVLYIDRKDIRIFNPGGRNRSIFMNIARQSSDRIFASVKEMTVFEIIGLMRQSLFFLGANAEKGQLWVLYYVFIFLQEVVSDSL